MKKKINGVTAWIPESEQILLDKYNKELAEAMIQFLLRQDDYYQQVLKDLNQAKNPENSSTETKLDHE